MLLKKSGIYGILTGVGLIAFFLLMTLFNQETNFNLRALNFVIIIIGIYLFHRNLYVTHKGEHEYFSGFIGGIQLTVTAIITLALFMVLYINVFDPIFLDVLESSDIWGGNLTVAEAAFAIGIEGMISGVAISFVLMQYFRKYIEDSKQTISE